MSDHPLPPLSPHSAAPHACSRSVRLEALSHAPLFAALPPEEIRELDTRAQSPGYRAGERIYRTGDGADGLFVVASGAVKLTWPSAEGHHIIISILGPGEAFGTVIGRERFTENAEAMTAACVVEIPAALVRDVLERYPKAALAALDTVFHRLQQSEQMIGQLSFGSVEARLAATLLSLAEKFGRASDTRVDLTIPLKRADLAAMARTTPETASRVLGRLHREGVVDVGRGWTSIIDRQRLRAIAAE